MMDIANTAIDMTIKALDRRTRIDITIQGTCPNYFGIAEIDDLGLQCSWDETSKQARVIDVTIKGEPVYLDHGDPLLIRLTGAIEDKIDEHEEK